MSPLTHLLGLSLCLVNYSTLVHPFPFSSSSILMLITSLVENTSTQGLPVEHGLSLHIRLDQGRQVLFDMGQRILFAENAQRLGIHLEEVDLAQYYHMDIMTMVEDCVPFFDSILMPQCMCSARHLSPIILSELKG